MPSNRLSLRLGQLPHDVLADLAARLCSDSPALQAAAEECMAAHKPPLPHEMVERVLLSPDLVPHIVGPLEAEDGAAAAVCSQWLVGWKATNEPRRRLKQVTIDLPEELRKILKPRMVVTPDGRLLADGGVTSKDWTKVAASDDSIFECTDGKLLRSTHEGALICGVYLEQPLCSRLAAFYCVLFGGDDGNNEDEIIALDDARALPPLWARAAQ